MIVEQQSTKDMVIEGIVPLAIDVGKQFDIININKVDMNEEDLED